MDYPLVLTPDDNDTYLVTCPDLPEVTSFGEGVTDAVARGADAVQEAIAARMNSFTDIPRPSNGDHYAHIPLYLDLKVQLFWALSDAGMKRADLVRLTDWSRTKVDRLFNPNHENKLAQMEEAFAALDKTVLVELEPA